MPLPDIGLPGGKLFQQTFNPSPQDWEQRAKEAQAKRYSSRDPNKAIQSAKNYLTESPEQKFKRIAEAKRQREVIRAKELPAQTKKDIITGVVAGSLAVTPVGSLIGPTTGITGFIRDTARYYQAESGYEKAYGGLMSAEQEYKEATSFGFVQAPVYVAMSPESQKVYGKEVEEYNKLFEAGLKTGLIQSTDEGYVLSYHPESSIDVAFVKQLGKEFQDIGVAESQAKYVYQKDVLMPLGTPTPYQVSKIEKYQTSLGEYQKAEKKFGDVRKELEKSQIYFTGFGEGKGFKGTLPESVTQFVPVLREYLPLEEEEFQQTNWVKAFVKAEGGELMRSTPLTKYGYSAGQQFVEWPLAHPVETAILYGIAGPVFSGVSSFGGQIASKFVFQHPTAVHVTQGIVGGGLLVVGGYPIVAETITHLKAGEYGKAGGVAGRTASQLTFLVGGTQFGKGFDWNVKAERQIYTTTQKTQFEAIKKGLQKSWTTPEQKVANVQTELRRIEPDFLRWATGRTQLQAVKVPQGETFDVAVVQRPSMININQLVTREKGAVIKREWVSGDLLKETTPKQNIVTIEGIKSRAETFENLLKIQKEAFGQPSITETLDFTKVETWSKLSPLEQQKVMANLESTTFVKTTVFGGFSSGKAPTSDIDLFRTLGYSSDLAKSISYSSRSLEIKQVWGGTGTVIMKGGEKIFDIHPMSERFLFPFTQETVTTQGITKTQTGEEMSRRMFGAFTSSERLGKDVPEFLRLAKVQEQALNIKYDLSSIETSFAKTQAIETLHTFTYPTPQMISIVRSIASKPEIPLSVQYPETKTSRIVRSIAEKPSFVSISVSKSFPSFYYTSPSVSTSATSYKSPSISVSKSISPSISPSYSGYISPSISPSMSISPSISPYISPSMAPQLPILPWLNLPPMPNLFGGYKGEGGKAKQKFKYQPQLYALFEGIRGKAPKTFTGLEFRPITSSRTKYKRRKK